MRPWSRGCGGRRRRSTLNCRRPVTRRCSGRSGASPGLRAPTSGSGSRRGVRDSEDDALAATHFKGNGDSRRRTNPRKRCLHVGTEGTGNEYRSTSGNQTPKPRDYREKFQADNVCWRSDQIQPFTSPRLFPILGHAPWPTKASRSGVVSK